VQGHDGGSSNGTINRRGLRLTVVWTILAAWISWPQNATSPVGAADKNPCERVKATIPVLTKRPTKGTLIAAQRRLPLKALGSSFGVVSCNSARVATSLGDLLTLCVDERLPQTLIASSTVITVCRRCSDSVHSFCCFFVVVVEAPTARYVTLTSLYCVCLRLPTSANRRTALEELALGRCVCDPYSSLSGSNKTIRTVSPVFAGAE
jgi:hypothetical protein